MKTVLSYQKYSLLAHYLKVKRDLRTSREVSNSSWYNPFSWGSTRTVQSTQYRTVNYTYANVHEAVGKLEDFVIETSRRLFDASSDAINLTLFRQDIKKAVKDLFDFSDDSFDPEMVLLPLSNAIERITIPAINLDLDNHILTIRQQFTTTEVEGDEITQLRNEQSRIVALVLKDIKSEVNECTRAILKKMSAEENHFIPGLTKDLSDQVEQLRRDLEYKEESLATYQEILLTVGK